MIPDLIPALNAALGEQYTVDHELGGGGMSRVFVAHDHAFERQVVVKVLAEHLVGGVSVERFKREVLLAAGLQHPHIVGVLSAGAVGDLPYFIMPWVDGASLRKRLNDGPLALSETVSILQDVARGLAYAHERGIVHRDVKPDNILLSHGAAALTDFGVAKALTSAREDGTPAASLTQEGMSLGTPTYMAPEQAAGEEELDARADIYALGVTAYEMLTGAPPFHGRTVTGLIAAHLSEPPAPIQGSGVPAGLRELVMAMLAKDPGDRPQSALDLVTALDTPEVRSGSWGTAAGRRTRNRAMAGVALAGVLAAAAFVVFQSGAGPGDIPERSIAVLPLVNLSGDTTDAYFAEGMTDELIAALQTVPGLRVASRTAVFAYGDRDAPPEDIGRDLRVSTLLAGTVRRGGERLRVTTELVSTRDGFTIWSQSYQAGMGDVFAVQDSISRAIVGALRDRFGDQQMAVDMSVGTRDLEAWDLYLRGRYFFSRRGAENLREAADYFTRAISRDPDFADAHAGLADVYSVLPLYASVPIDSVLPLGVRAADRAIALDPTLAQAYASRGSLHQLGWRWDEAERDYLQAITLDPEYATAHQWYGELLLVLGRSEDAVRELARARDLDPVSPVIAGSYAGALGKAGRVNEALREAREAVALGQGADVSRMFLAAVELYDGRWDAAVQTLRTAADGPVVLRGLLGYGLARAGRTAEAHDVLRRLRAQGPASGTATSLARVFVGLAEPDSALAWLETGVDRHDVLFAAETLWSPIWEPLHDTPRFATILRRLGLPGAE